MYFNLEEASKKMLDYIGRPIADDFIFNQNEITNLKGSLIVGEIVYFKFKDKNISGKVSKVSDKFIDFIYPDLCIEDKKTGYEYITVKSVERFLNGEIIIHDKNKNTYISFETMLSLIDITNVSVYTKEDYIQLK
ncbi:MAG: hypothetical protein R3Y05_01935 [bacterium]